MAISYKVLGQINPTANALTTLYTVPTGNSAVISTISVCNQSDSSSKFSLAVQPANAAIEAKHYINYNAAIAGNSSVNITIGLTLAASDVVSAAAESANVSFNAFGSEISS